MIGTAKQVKWAEDIRAKKMVVINDALTSMAKKLAAKPAELEMVQALRDELASKSASFWIDARDDFALDIMRKVGKEILSRTSQTAEQGKTMDKQENAYMAYGSKDGAAFFCTAPSTYGNKNPEIAAQHPGVTVKVAALPFGEDAIEMADLVAFYESEGFSVDNCDGPAVIMAL